MCPKQGVEKSLLPDCHIANPVLMYSMLHALHRQDRGTEQMDAELRDRFELFRQVMHNFPVPLRARSTHEYVYEALQEHQQELLAEAQSSTSMENNVSGSSSVSTGLSSSTNLSTHCDLYEDAQERDDQDLE